MPRLVSIVHPASIALFNEALQDKRFDEAAIFRMVMITSAWDAAIKQFGDTLQQLYVYVEDDGTISWKGTNEPWEGRVD